MDQIRDIVPTHEPSPLPSTQNCQWSDKRTEQDEESRVASLEERFANWGTD
jgi:hypothetical protein